MRFIKIRWGILLHLIFLMVFLLTACSPIASENIPTRSPGLTVQPPPATTTADSPNQAPTAPPAQTALSTPAPVSPTTSPAGLISTDRLYGFLEDLTSIRPYLGWRNSSSQGEREALDYVEQTLTRLEFLKTSGLEIERQTFNTFLGTEFWETHLEISIDGVQVQVPASGLRGSRDDIEAALFFDSDGKLNDRDRNPVVVNGGISVVRSERELNSLPAQEAAAAVVFADYALFDRYVVGEASGRNALTLLEKQPAGIVLVTQYSNQAGESHGTFVGEGGVFSGIRSRARLPILSLRLEDLSKAGIQDWEDLSRISAAQLTWDADVFSPAVSGNLMATIPGLDASRSVIISAHIDSPNSPGALDDGSGSAILLEIAHILEAGQIQPPTDLHLVWFGSEELGLFGSSYFSATHSELLDKTVGLLQIDCLSRPLENVPASLSLISWPQAVSRDPEATWMGRLAQLSASQGIQVETRDLPWIASDNSSFSGFDVPNAVLIYEDQAMERLGGVWYAGHLHDPYDTVALAKEVEDAFVEMTQVALLAALDAPGSSTAAGVEQFRSTPASDRRAVFVASHTEASHMTPAGFLEFGMTLSAGGFDVDVTPYGIPLQQADLEGADLVFILPVVDYPGDQSQPHDYDEEWQPAEVEVIQSYVAEGGLLVITNSARRLKYMNTAYDANEDWSDANAVAQIFGISFSGPAQANQSPLIESSHPLMEGVRSLTPVYQNWVNFSLEQGEVLATTNANPLIALSPYGDSGGEVLVLGDLGLLGSTSGRQDNQVFWENLIEYTRDR